MATQKADMSTADVAPAFFVIGHFPSSVLAVQPQAKLSLGLFPRTVRIGGCDRAIMCRFDLGAS